MQTQVGIIMKTKHLTSRAFVKSNVKIIQFNQRAFRNRSGIYIFYSSETYNVPKRNGRLNRLTETIISKNEILLQKYAFTTKPNCVTVYRFHRR